LALARRAHLSGEIEIVASQDPGCKRLMPVPTLGPIISSAVVAAIDSGAVFFNGHDFRAWLGLAPKQISTRDRTIGKVSKQSNRYLRVLFVRSNAPTRGRIHFGSPEPEIARCLADAG
jgi:transposase